jgi:hypothetical protein
MYVVSKNKRVNIFSPDLFRSFFIFANVCDSVVIYYHFPPMADIDTPQDAEQNLITPPDEMLELTAGEEHLMLASLPEEKLLNSGKATVSLSEPTIVEAIAPAAPVVAIAPLSPAALPITEDLFADLPISPVEKVVPQDIESIQAMNQIENKTLTDNTNLGNTGFLPPQE